MWASRPARCYARAVLQGVYAVPEASPITTIADVGREGVRVGVKLGSAYDLYLSRTLEHATVVRGDEGTDTFLAQGLEVATGIRQPVTAFVATHPGHRVFDGRFMRIQQAVGTTRTRLPATVDFLRSTVDDLKTNGFIAEALKRSGQDQALVAE